MRPERPAPVDHVHAARLGIDHQPLEHAVPGKRHQVARLNHAKTLTSAVIDGRDYLRARAET